LKNTRDERTKNTVANIFKFWLLIIDRAKYKLVSTDASLAINFHAKFEIITS